MTEFDARRAALDAAVRTLGRTRPDEIVRVAREVYLPFLRGTEEVPDMVDPPEDDSYAYGPQTAAVHHVLNTYLVATPAETERLEEAQEALGDTRVSQGILFNYAGRVDRTDMWAELGETDLPEVAQAVMVSDLMDSFPPIRSEVVRLLGPWISVFGSIPGVDLA